MKWQRKFVEKVTHGATRGSLQTSGLNHVSGQKTATDARRPHSSASAKFRRWTEREMSREQQQTATVFKSFSLFLNTAISAIIPPFPRCWHAARFLCGYITRLCWLLCLLWCVFHHFVAFFSLQQRTFSTWRFFFFNLRFAFCRVFFFHRHIFSLSGLLSPLSDHFVYLARTC